MSAPIYGTRSRLIALLFQKNGQDLTLQPNQATTYTGARAFQLPPGDASDSLVGAAATQTLTNKTMSGAANTFTGISLTSAVTGTLPAANGGTGTTSSTGSGSVVLATSPTLVSPALGTPTALVLTNATALPLTSGVIGLLPVANGGTGASGASAARTSLGAAESGANSSITSLSGLSTPLSIGQGGTGQVTAGAAFAALSPLTTLGDLVYEGAGPAPARLPVGSSGQILTVVAGAPAWANPGSSSDFKASWITGDGTTKVVTHNLGTLDVAVQLYDKTDGTTIQVDSVARTDTNTLTLTSSQAPGAAGWRILIQSV